MTARRWPTGLLFPLGLVLIWELASDVGLVPSAWFPAPSQVLAALAMLARGELWEHAWATLLRLLLAFVLAAVPGVLLGLAMGLSPFWRALLEPYVLVFYPMPKIALLPLAMILMGVNERTFVAVAALTAFLQILVNTMGGVAGLDRTLLQAAENYGARGWRLFFIVVLPGTLPHVFTGLRLGLGLALVLTVIIEFTAARVGLGSLVLRYWQTLQVQPMFAVLLVIGIIGLVVTRGLEWAGTRLMPWYEDVSVARTR